MKTLKTWTLAAALTVTLTIKMTGEVCAQSSSLYVTETPAQRPVRRDPAEPVDPLSPAIARASLAAVPMPEPRQYAVHDLVTIVVRESTESDSSSKLDVTKDSKFNGEVKAFPHLHMDELLKGFIQGGDLTDGPKIDAKMKKDFQGDGEAKRSDSFTDRITARIIDIKPNGTMVLEARKHTKTDDESLDMVLTGTCRKQDVTISNTILSTQLYDLHLDKAHGGELRKSTKKGWITKTLDTVFGF